MTTKKFNDKLIAIRKIDSKDLKRAKDFQEYINSLVLEDAKILMNRKIDLKGEREFIKRTLRIQKAKAQVFLVAECNKKIVGTAKVELERWRRNHIGKLGISIRSGYRGIGLGSFMMKEIIKLTKKELNPKPKIIQLEVYSNNKPAINLYKKTGFKIVAKVPKQVQYQGKLVADIIMILYL